MTLTKTLFLPALAALSASFFVSSARADVSPMCGAYDNDVTCDAASVDKTCKDGKTVCHSVNCDPGNAGAAIVYKCFACPTEITDTNKTCVDLSNLNKACGTNGTCAVATPGCTTSSKYYCEGNEPGAGGVTHCGGLIAAMCPDGLTCVDDPSDNCDTTKGGADCPGICTSATEGSGGTTSAGGTSAGSDGSTSTVGGSGGTAGTTASGGTAGTTAAGGSSAANPGGASDDGGGCSVEGLGHGRGALAALMSLAGATAILLDRRRRR